MIIGFDAKRAFRNHTGLGNYSRSLINAMALYYPENDYHLFTPKLSDRYSFVQKQVFTHTPQNFWSKQFSSLWRSSWIKKDLQIAGIELYHGLSHEIPFGIEQTGIKSVVTMHDLIIERYPEQFKKTDRHIYRRKYLNACKNANSIIAISEQTKQDLVDFYHIAPDKITVCYQSCDTQFAQSFSAEALELVRKKYALPKKFFLYVGSIIERKNLLRICEAMHALPPQDRQPLVIVGKGRNAYRQQINDFIEQHQLTKHFLFLSEKFEQKGSLWADLPAIYQLSIALIYPSIFEGFGIPILEALCASTPVITSNLSCLPEAGGDAAYYVNPFDTDAIARAMQALCDEDLRKTMREKGLKHAQRFSPEACAQAVKQVYEAVLY